MSSPLVIVQARLGSKRLPNKIAMDLCGQSMLSHIVERASRIAPVVVAFPKPEENEDDVLSRYARVAKLHGDADPLIRITADCPLLDAGLGLGILDRYLQGVNDCVGTGPEFDGLDIEVFSRVALRNADMFAQSARDRENVTPWMKRHLLYEEIGLRGLNGRSLRWSVDTSEGLEFVRQVFSACPECRAGTPWHTNSQTSIGGSDRHPVFELHQVDRPDNRGGLVECLAHDLLMQHTQDEPYVST